MSHSTPDSAVRSPGPAVGASPGLPPSYRSTGEACPRSSAAPHEVEDLTELFSEVADSVGRYCKNRPGVVAGVLFGLGFVVGWKAKPW